ncbi:unnamed protein product [Amoebophrya sp. A25]|nr:unnamed protein product [Amoebophrya sp. A25]|eukprot:GSA25T00013712001.1
MTNQMMSPQKGEQNGMRSLFDNPNKQPQAQPPPTTAGFGPPAQQQQQPPLVNGVAAQHLQHSLYGNQAAAAPPPGGASAGVTAGSGGVVEGFVGAVPAVSGDNGMTSVGGMPQQYVNTGATPSFASNARPGPGSNYTQQQLPYAPPQRTTGGPPAVGAGHVAPTPGAQYNQHSAATGQPSSGAYYPPGQGQPNAAATSSSLPHNSGGPSSQSYPGATAPPSGAPPQGAPQSQNNYVAGPLPGSTASSAAHEQPYLQSDASNLSNGVYPPSNAPVSYDAAFQSQTITNKPLTAPVGATPAPNSTLSTAASSTATPWSSASQLTSYSQQSSDFSNTSTAPAPRPPVVTPSAASSSSTAQYLGSMSGIPGHPSATAGHDPCGASGAPGGAAPNAQVPAIITGTAESASSTAYPSQTKNIGPPTPSLPTASDTTTYPPPDNIPQGPESPPGSASLSPTVSPGDYYEKAYNQHMGASGGATQKATDVEETAEEAYRRKMRERAAEQQKGQLADGRQQAAPSGRGQQGRSGDAADESSAPEVSRSKSGRAPTGTASASYSGSSSAGDSYDESGETDGGEVPMPTIIPNPACAYPVFEAVMDFAPAAPPAAGAPGDPGIDPGTYQAYAQAGIAPPAIATVPPSLSGSGVSPGAPLLAAGGTAAYAPPPPPMPGAAGGDAGPPPYPNAQAPPQSLGRTASQQSAASYQGVTIPPGSDPYSSTCGAPPSSGYPSSASGGAYMQNGAPEQQAMMVPDAQHPNYQVGGSSSTSPPKSPTKQGTAGLGMGNNPMYKAGAQTRQRQVSSSKIDPEHIPRPVNIGVVTSSSGKQIKTFATDKYVTPPNVAMMNRCVFVDKGSCSARFIRMTCNQIPIYHHTADCTHVPIAAVCQPFASLGDQEASIPLIDTSGTEGPFRCPRCKAYVNAFFGWVSCGKEANCNFCGHYFEVPRHYYCSLDYAGHRRDRNDRPELCTGTVDYLAPPEYYAQLTKPQVPYYLFVIEVTRQAMDTGYVHQVMNTIRSMLNHFPGNKTKVGIMTFDSTIHCYHFGGTSGEPAVVVQADVGDPDFAPESPDALFVDPRSDPSSIESLAELIPKLYRESTDYHSCAGAALTSAISLFKSRGGTGQVMMFMHSLPTRGIGLNVPRDDVRLYSEDEQWKDRMGELFVPQNPDYYKRLSETCLDMDVCVDVFLLPPENTYIDVATQSYVPRCTGGDTFHYPGFNLHDHGEQLHFDISRHIVRRQAFGCAFKIRSSRGLTVSSMFAPHDSISRHEQSQFEVSRLSADSTAAFVFKHEDLAENARHAYVQIACLYTTTAGLKCIRVHTLSLATTNALSTTFRYCCVDTLANVLLKETLRKELAAPNSPQPKQQLTDQLVHILHAYRVNCASTSSFGQLILPESLKLLPLYICSLFKQMAFRRKSLTCRVDQRFAEVVQLLGATITRTSSLLYPRLVALHRFQEKHGLAADDENVYMPSNIQCSMDRVSLQGLYLYENGERIVIYVGPNASAELLDDAFGASQISEISGLNLQKPLGARIYSVLQQIRKDKGSYRWMRIQYTNEDTRMLLVEDPLRQELSYVDYLCMVHRRVQQKLEQY